MPKIYETIKNNSETLIVEKFLIKKHIFYVYETAIWDFLCI